MSDVITSQFAPKLEQWGFFKEWCRLIKEGQKPEILANYFMEQLRFEDSSVRFPYVACQFFMSSRSWAEFLEACQDVLSEEEKTIFSDKKAGKFYIKFRDMVAAQIIDYWHHFLDNFKAVNEEIGQELKDMPTSRLEAIIKSIVQVEVSKQVQHLNDAIAKGMKEEWVKVIVDEIKKRFDEGESWKTGEGEPEPEPE